MEHSKIKIFTTLIILLVIITACNSDTKIKSIGFYDYTKKWDLNRIPLIEPYQLLSADNGHSWVFKRNDKEDVINYAGISDSTIVLFSKRTALPGMMSKAWFVIKLNPYNEKLFTNEMDYKKQLENFGLSSVKLYDVKLIFQEFSQLNKLPKEWTQQPKPNLNK